MALVNDFSLTRFMLMFTVVISTIVSTVAFWLFIFGIPILVVRDGG